MYKKIHHGPEAYIIFVVLLRGLWGRVQELTEGRKKRSKVKMMVGLTEKRK